ncbi:triose-phosphate isomerase [bacterium]|nr:triose-phosphate isomerase [bacterium]
MLLAANWKMNKTPTEARAFVREYLVALPKDTKTPTVILPPFPALPALAEELEDVPPEKVSFGAQNLHNEVKGAFTGEVSAPMLKDCGCRWAVVGHSERRRIFGEQNEVLNKKLRAALSQNLTPIYCIGETLEEREAGELEKVLVTQLTEGFEGFSSASIERTVIAYEPVWAIGTGQTATPEQAQEAHAFVRSTLADKLQVNARKMKILYGGSVTPENAYSLLSQKDIDGALVGGASLKVDSLLSLLAASDRALQEKK